MAKIQVGIAQRPANGEVVCGDHCAVVAEGAVTLIAVADGLGHGPHAATAAQQFCAVVADRRQQTPYFNMLMCAR